MIEVAEALILDAVVLIGFETAGWFDSMEFWYPDYELLVPQLLWKEEFEAAPAEPPEWIQLCPVTPPSEAQQPGALSIFDWRCIALAETHSGTIITADKNLKQCAEDRSVSTLWAGRFALDTFEQCGISVDEFRAGVEAFIDDMRMPPSSATELQNAEKP